MRMCCYGNFNMSKVSWATLEVSDRTKQLFIDELFKRDFDQVIDFPTRKSAILDFVLIQGIDMIATNAWTKAVSTQSNHKPTKSTFKSQGEFMYRQNDVQLL